MKMKIWFAFVFIAITAFGVETFHNDTTKWGDFEAIYCYAQSVWTSTPIEETCAGTMNERYTVPNGLPYSVAVILLFKLFNLMPYWLAGYIWVLGKAFAITYILWRIRAREEYYNVLIFFTAILLFGGFFLSNTGQSVTFIIALFTGAMIAFTDKRYKTFVVLILLSALFKYYTIWALFLPVILYRKHQGGIKESVAGLAVFAAYMILQHFVYPDSVAMVSKFAGFYNAHFIPRLLAAGVMIAVYTWARYRGGWIGLLDVIFPFMITFMAIGHKNEYNLGWLVVPFIVYAFYRLVYVEHALRYFIAMILLHAITLHRGIPIPADYHLYFIAWGICAYITLDTLWDNIKAWQAEKAERL
jgi:hypothetical protein